MIEAWNSGDAAGFAAPFTDTADYVAFEGTHLIGHDEIEAFHHKLFDTVLKGTRLVRGEVRFVRLLDPQWAVMHAFATTILAGAQQPTPARDSMQLFVAHRLPIGWRIEALQNSRQLSLERQQFLDQVDQLPPDRIAQLVNGNN